MHLIPTNCIDSVRVNMASTNVGTSYVELISALAGRCQMALISETSNNGFVLAYGPSGSEVALLKIIPNMSHNVPPHIEQGTRIAVKSESGTISSGIITIDFFG